MRGSIETERAITYVNELMKEISYTIWHTHTHIRVHYMNGIEFVVFGG